ncbi:DUF2809 domain-containing protein, partial [Streptosporangium sp. NPDC048865]|uniref:DUF2809 domain-containing protein n=1 Tax=Streptosporangium sp. NPDC048865 TaxID=3155766 RepID=UPI0034177174
MSPVPRTGPPLPRPSPPRRTRLIALLAALATVAAGLTVRALTGGWFGKYAGDALYTVLVYALVVLVWPRITPVRAAACALAFSWAVELDDLPAVRRRRGVPSGGDTCLEGQESQGFRPVR